MTSRSIEASKYSCSPLISQALGAHFDLLNRFLARNIQHIACRFGNLARHLQEAGLICRCPVHPQRGSASQSPGRHPAHDPFPHSRQRCGPGQAVEYVAGPEGICVPCAMACSANHRRPLLAAKRFAGSSVTSSSEFHAPQSGHLPTHFALFTATLLADEFCT